MASIIATPKGYRAHVYVKGQRTSKLFRTRREAVAWATATEEKLRENSTLPEGDRKTFKDALTRYAEDVSPTKRGRVWEERRIGAMLKNTALPLAQPISKITTPDLVLWREARKKEVSPGTILRDMNLLASVFETARLEWQWIKINPMRDLSKPSAPPHRNVVITRPQIKALLRVMGHRIGGPAHSVTQSVALAFLLALRTGMRAGEICNLEWRHVHDGYCHLPITKTKARDVPLTPKAMRYIERMRGYDKDRVFDLKPATLDALFRKYRARAGLSGFTFHDSRHTAATWIAGRMSSKGLPAQQAVLDLCKIFGWSNTAQALTYYNPSAADIAARIS